MTDRPLGEYEKEARRKNCGEILRVNDDEVECYLPRGHEGDHRWHLGPSAIFHSAQRDQEHARLRDKWWESQCVVEIATRNPQVAEYCEHWEGRVEKAEARYEKLVRAATKNKRCVFCGGQQFDHLGDKEIGHRADCALRSALSDGENKGGK